MGKKVTAEQVADAAGVSRSAVSLVFNGRGDDFLSTETQLRIREAAGRLGYTPNLVARSLRNQQTKLIGILSNAAVTGPFDGEIIGGADAVAREHGYLTLSADTENQADQGADTLRRLLDQGVDGLIYLTVGLHETRVLDDFMRVPAALANCFPGPGSPEGADLLPRFIPDEVSGGRVGTEHLIGFGHRRIGLLRGEQDTPASGWREDGFREAMAAAGVPVDESLVTDAGFQISPGYHGAMRLLDVSADRRPTALVAPNDRVAIGTILAAGRLGLRVPEDLSVVGYDDQRNVASDMVPALTTVALPLSEMGRRAMRAVLAAVEPDKFDAATRPVGEVRLECGLVVRESTAPVSG